MNGLMQSPIELGDVVRRFEPTFPQTHGARLLPSQRKALEDIASCHTAARGGHRYHCEDCGENFWIYHGCGNRSCPSCHTQAMRKWIDHREEQMLGCRYFHLVVTVPETMRAAFLANQKLLYGMLMTTVSSCVRDLARDPKFLGATPAILTVLHTWRWDLHCHPHVHLLVSAGGVSEDGQHWVTPCNKKWFLPVRVLSKLVRGRFRAQLKKTAPDVFRQIDFTVWKQGWNSFCKPYGKGAKAVLNYLGRYVYRVAISNARLVSMDQTLRLPGEEFLRRFVMHVLPRGFHKVRYYGLWHHSQRKTRHRIRLLLASPNDMPKLEELLNTLSTTDEEASESASEQNVKSDFLPICPTCKSQNVRLVEVRLHNRSP